MEKPGKLFFNGLFFLRENLNTGNPWVFTCFYHEIDRAFRCKFSHHPILWDSDQWEFQDPKMEVHTCTYHLYKATVIQAYHWSIFWPEIVLEMGFLWGFGVGGREVYGIFDGFFHCGWITRGFSMLDGWAPPPVMHHPMVSMVVFWSC